MFLKKCTVANYCKKMKQVLEKIEENAQFVEKERRNVNFQLKDDKLIAAWETTLKNKETPLQKYFDNWNKLNNVQKRKSITKNDELAEELPVLKKRVKKSEDKNDDGPVELFPSDDENDDDIMKKLSEGEALVEEESKKKKTKKDKKKKKLQVKDIQVDDDLAADQAADEVTDFNVNEW